jgi:tripartite-type tricarboxylate transporter receptor subunit TctC
MLAALVGLTALVTNARAEDARAFFKGKHITILIPFAPGGGYDAYARLLAPHFGKYLDAQFIIKNMPGGGGLLALGQLAAAKPDGTTIMLAEGAGAALAQLQERSSVRYDLLKVGHLGTVAESPWLVLTSPKLDIKTLDDLIKKGKSGLSWAATGPAAALASGPKMACDVLGMDKCKIVLGYKGSAAAALAVAKGEMDAMYVSDTSAEKYVNNGDLVPIVVFGRKRSRYIPATATIFEMRKLSKDDEWIIDFFSNMQALGRILIVTQGTPPDRLKLLQDMTKAVLTDPAVVAESEKRRREIVYSDGETTKRNVESVLKIDSPEKKKRALSVLNVEG